MRFHSIKARRPLISWFWLLTCAIHLIMGQTASAQTQDFPDSAEKGASAYAFDMTQLSLGNGRFMENQNRTLTYLKWVDVDRLLYVFRATHKLDLKGAKPTGGWDAPNFRFRSHVQGHFLTAWAQCYATLKDDECKRRAQYFVAELAKCQANNKAAGFSRGYLAGFPESEFTNIENVANKNRNVPYYAMHKTLAGLLDVWHYMRDTQARDVLMALSHWVDLRTSRLSYERMQKMMQTEFGGMAAVMIDVYYATGDKKWIDVAKRFDHATVFDPLAANVDRLSGLHANTQIPKFIAATREYKATGAQRYLDIARNAWNITVFAHSYAIGGNSQGELFHEPNAIAKYVARDTAEGCNTYNMLKLTRELFTLHADSSSTMYFDFYERALINHLLGQQDTNDPHGHITYHTPLKPGGRRGVGPWGEARYSDDYGSFWCCQGTGVETNTKYMDSIYWHDATDSTLFINLFTSSTLRWTKRNAIITQETNYPVGDTSVLTLRGSSGTWKLKVRIPSWTSNATLSINGAPVDGLRTVPGRYAEVSREWKDGDRVEIRLPMRLWSMPANDKPEVAAIFFGPSIISGNYGQSTLTAMPTIDLGSVCRVGDIGLRFTAVADDKPVDLGAFYDAHGFNYNVYWITKGQLPGSCQ